MNTQRYVTSVQRRFYAAYWLNFCKLINVEAQTHGAFDKNGHLIGLSLPRSLFSKEKLLDSVRSIRMVYSITENEVEVRCFLMGSRYYRFVFFEDTIAIDEDTDENVRKLTGPGQ